MPYRINEPNGETIEAEDVDVDVLNSLIINYNGIYLVFDLPIIRKAYIKLNTGIFIEDMMNIFKFIVLNRDLVNPFIYESIIINPISLFKYHTEFEGVQHSLGKNIPRWFEKKYSIAYD